jgi:hypothetical protein
MNKAEKGDSLIDRGADGLEELSRKAAAKGGVAAKLADELADSAVFLRKLKPSLIKERAQGNAATPGARLSEAGTSSDGSSATPAPPVVPPPPPEEAATPVPEAAPVAAVPPVTAEVAAPVTEPTPEPKRGPERKGLNPFVVAGVALVAGIVLAKVIDWRSHAHPRD